jgi:adenylate cyclase class 2
MEKEIEAKFLDVNHEEMRERLKQVGAVLTQPETHMSRVNMDFPDGSLNQKGGWLRIRDEGTRVMMTYKQLNSWDIHGVQEVQTKVDSFKTAVQLMQAVGMVETSYQETKRESWRLDDVEIVLDTWPWVKSYIEIEGPSEAHVQDSAHKLGFRWDNAVFGSVEPVYQAEYSITIDEFYKLTRITFEDQPPAWLEERRI